MVTKAATVLTQDARDDLKKREFAIPSRRAYPIHDETHARAALSMVAKHGTPEEKSQVHAAVAKKYPGLAARSSVEDVREKVKRANMMNGGSYGPSHDATGLGSSGPKMSATVNPSNISVASPPKVASVLAENMAKGLTALKGGGRGVLEHLDRNAINYDLAGLGMLAALPVDEIQAKLRTAQGEDPEQHRFLHDAAHPAVDFAGLATLAAPGIATKLLGKAGHLCTKELS